ncbi:hypothetical protein [Actinomadura sp. CNU-125]|uniref:hypothetical protein n=1 Tax=Actinomadura sp. CNU-125 TaxID=1904961 RepID=UPI0021CCD048|nr:hypothetical protein [Actinomadura sp. CNU-125]
MAGIGGNGDRDGAWAFVRRFAREWRTPLVPGDGCEASELARAEGRLGLALPAAMREAYALFGRRADLTSRQDRLLAPEKLRVDDGMLVYRVENQHVVEWGVPLSRLADDDPPVCFRGYEGRRNYLERFSLACVEMVMSESVLAADERHLGNRWMEPADASRVEELYSPLPFPEYPMWAMDDGTIRWFAGPDVLLRSDAGEWLWVLGRTEAAVNGVRAALPGEWTA